MTDTKIGLAEQRTNMSEDRTVLANERTLAGWLRTGLAAIGIGLAFNALFNRIDPSWVPKSIATAFLGLAVLIFVTAERRASKVLSRLEAHRIETVKLSNLRLITSVAVTATIALIAAIWFLPIQPPRQ